MTCSPSNELWTFSLCTHCSEYPLPLPHSFPDSKSRENAFAFNFTVPISALTHLIPSVLYKYIHDLPLTPYTRQQLTMTFTAPTVLYQIHLTTYLSSFLEHTCPVGRDHAFALSPSSHQAYSAFSKWMDGWMDGWMDDLMYDPNILYWVNIRKYAIVCMHTANLLMHLIKCRSWS